MSKTGKVDPSPSQIIPSGELIELSVDQIIPSKNNPRHLFDQPQLDALKKSISEHGVLVPIIVYQQRAQKKYLILDGERRYRCCLELRDEGKTIKIPANIVSPPTKIAGLLYMFSIHNFREQWELMPTALGLKSVMETLRETDNAVLTKLTGLSDPQIERCKKLLEFPEKYQQLSLEQNPEERIPSNFWIELYPVLELIDKELPDLKKRLGRDGITDALVDKYRANRIKSVIHFRRIIEAYEVAEARRPEVLARVKEYVQNTNLETRQAFDEFVVDNRRTQSAVDACTSFVRELKRLKIDYATFDRRRVRRALEAVRTYADELIEKLKGQDPRVGEATGEDEE